MGWLELIVAAAAGIASMRTAMERGDIDEAARQGMLAGPAVIEQALAAPDRMTRLAAIAAAPSARGRVDLLEPLADVAAGPDRRTAIPAARAARTIARGLAERDRPDDLAPADLATLRDRWAQLARRADRWIELRVFALDTAAALDPGGTGVELALALADPDPSFRRAATAVVPVPVPEAMRAPLAATIAKDPNDGVALAAAAVLCFDLVADPPKPILDALGPAGLERIRSLVTGPGAKIAIKNAARCLTAAKPRARK